MLRQMSAVIRANVSWELKPIQFQMIVSIVKRMALGTDYTTAATKISFYLKLVFEQQKYHYKHGRSQKWGQPSVVQLPLENKKHSFPSPHCTV